MLRFLGAESLENSPYLRLRIARVESVYYDAGTAGTPSGAVTPEEFAMGKLLITWLDWGGQRDFVTVAFPFFSNARETDTSEGMWYGDISLPSKGDIVLLGFLDPANAVMLGYLPRNYKKETTTDGSTPSTLGSIRRIIPGEMLRVSKQQAEIYMDRAGAIHLAARAQPKAGVGNSLLDGSQITDVSQIDPTRKPKNLIMSLTVGEAYEDTEAGTWKDRSVVPGTDRPTVFRITGGDKKATIEIDVDGNITIEVGRGAKLRVQTADPALSPQLPAPNTRPVSRKDDKVKSTSSEDSAFWTFINNLFTIFNAHTHSSAGAGPPQTLLTGLPSSMTGKITEGSSIFEADG